MSIRSSLLPIYTEIHPTVVALETTKKYKKGCCLHSLQIFFNIFYCIFQSTVVPFVLFGPSLWDPNSRIVLPIAILVSTIMVFTWQFPSCSKFHWRFYDNGDDIQLNYQFKLNILTKYSYKSMLELMIFEIAFLPFLHIIGILTVIIFFPLISPWEAIFTWKSLLGGMFFISITSVFVIFDKLLKYLRNK